jgi:hypothetical protein
MMAFFIESSQKTAEYWLIGQPNNRNVIITQSFSAAKNEAWKMNEQRFPKEWDEKRVKQLIAKLDARTEEEWIAADEAVSAESVSQTVITVLKALLPEIRRFLATHKTA